MPFALLATKLYIPPARPNLVPRPRLVNRLKAGLQGALTLVSAPAGSGKTVLQGSVTDQAALHGILNRIRDLNLKLLYVARQEEHGGDSHQSEAAGR